MFAEAAQAPAAIANQLDGNRALVSRIASKMRSLSPRAIITGARGSSDHAATFAKYLIETRTGTITSSAGLSTASIYASPGRFADTVFLAISQSGQSPDLLTATADAKRAGALTIALVNASDSPLAEIADEVLPLHAGAERAVAATKSYLASCAAVIDLVAHWCGDEVLLSALRDLPLLLSKAWLLDWSLGAGILTPATDLYVIGRGLGFGAAQEAALKLKETCGLHAEAFSAAEVQHGPMALIRRGFPVLMMSQNDATRDGMADLLDRLARNQADVLLTGFSDPRASMLPWLNADPVLQPLLFVQSFYRMANALSVARGLNPDRPPNLNKITETV
jgi:glucosamine--fructose-6-phosphate aminotransferase (isomerizing)